MLYRARLPARCGAGSGISGANPRHPGRPHRRRIGLAPVRRPRQAAQPATDLIRSFRQSMTTLEPGQAAYVRKPTARFMTSHPAHFIAQGFGSGLSPIMPGTSGTLFAWLSFAVLSARWPELFTAFNWAVIIGVGFVIGGGGGAGAGRGGGGAGRGGGGGDE